MNLFRFHAELTTVEVTTTAPPIAQCQRMDNPKCGQKSADFWTKEMCESRSVGWRRFMNRVCPALCSQCQSEFSHHIIV